jgi:hypothetical protein
VSTGRSLFAYGAFTAWVILSDALSGEFLPALARDVHWLILPLLVVLYTRLFAEERRYAQSVASGWLR